MKSFFTKNGIRFTAKDISQDKIAYREWHDKYKGDMVPLIVFGSGGKVVDGADIPKIKRILLDYQQQRRLGEQKAGKNSPFNQ